MKQSQAKLKEGGSIGGSAARGSKKRRDMKGVKPGEGSAGRSDSGRVGVKIRVLELPRSARMVNAACDEYFDRVGIVWDSGGFGGMIRREVDERMAKKNQELAELRKRPRWEADVDEQFSND